MGFHYLSVATKPHAHLDLLTSLSKHFDLGVRILGKNDTNLTQWGRCFSTKTKLYHEALKGLNGNDIVVLSDAYDVLPLAGKDEIVTKFQNLHCDILYNAEQYCFPYPDIWTRYDRVLPENKAQRFRYLNSGMIVGYASKLLQMLDYYPYSLEDDDQGYHTRAFLDIVENKTLDIKIKLDTRHDLCYAMAGDIGGLRFDTDLRRFQSFVTDGWPVLIHCNGSIGETMPTFTKWNEYHQIRVVPYVF